ncbi:unnamed protein product [Chironomus riparius]|uniref:Odorant receptor n=1 Tax=Chironomus riparius TaxID=315576 RepID=A0A9N9WRB9_9DIPT|nr:unnamed protein product [Chironomus riparius]
MDMPSEKVIAQRRRHTRFSNIIGADLQSPRLYHPRVITMSVIGTITISVIQLNGLYKAWPNILSICQTLFFIPLILQIFSRIINRYGLNDEAINRELLERLMQFNRNHENNLIYRLVLLKKLNFYYSFFNATSLGYFIVIHMPFIGIIASAAFSGTYQLMAPIYLPFVDATKLWGFIVNAIVQLLLTEITFFALTTLDFQFMFYSYHIASMFDILSMKFTEFGNKLTDHPRSNFKYIVRKFIIRVHKDPAERSNKEMLIHLIKDYYKITKYTSLLFKEMKIPVFMTITSGGFALCLSALTMLSNSTIIGALGIFFYMTQIATSCILVTFVIHQYEMFLNRIYKFPWYLLSNSDQKIFLQYLQICQNFDDFELPMIGTVDMELFTTVVNTDFNSF